MTGSRARKKPRRRIGRVSLYCTSILTSTPQLSASRSKGGNKGYFQIVGPICSELYKSTVLKEGE